MVLMALTSALHVAAACCGKRQTWGCEGEVEAAAIEGELVGSMSLAVASWSCNHYSDFQIDHHRQRV